MWRCLAGVVNHKMYAGNMVGSHECVVYEEVSFDECLHIAMFSTSEEAVVDEHTKEDHDGHEEERNHPRHEDYQCVTW